MHEHGGTCSAVAVNPAHATYDRAGFSTSRSTPLQSECQLHDFNPTSGLLYCHHSEGTERRTAA